MDKNTLVGLLLIGAIVIGFGILNGPSDEEIAEQKRLLDSIEQVDAIQQEVIEEQAQKTESSFSEAVDSKGALVSSMASDSAQMADQIQAFGAFASSSIGEAKTFIVETDLMKLTFSTKGGNIQKAVLKEYFQYAEDGEEGAELVLFDSTSNFNLNFFTRDSKNITTDELVFTTDASSQNINGDDERTVSFKLDAGADRYIEYVYKIKGNDYMIDFDVNMVEMDQIVDMRSGEVYVNWMVNAPSQEKSLKPQRDATTIFYKYKNEDVDDLGISDDREELEASMKWVSLKQQFFNTTLIADEYFDKSRAFMETVTDEGETEYVKKLTIALTLPVSGSKIEKLGMSMYLGPNKYDILEGHGNELQNIINLGWGIFGWVNQFAVIPVFHFLEDFNWNYGIIILILTILLKLILMPITYKTYLSGAKMRVLKPEISEINDKHKDDAMKKQQATMALYRQTGVNPLSGCIPLLIQMPILFAMFRFFPASIELRQESFLWADDLSTYDSIYTFPAGFDIPFYGDHVSLFTILMAISIAFYTKMNSQMSMGAMAEGPMAAQMKIMTYMMPVMMLFFFNNYSSGLSYYYLLANVISIGQTVLIRKVFINEDSIRAKIEMNKKKPKNQKKSGFQKRLEDMSKQQQAKLKNKK
ncbi:MAG: YidC/Oxa1 family membrane protein insertase [Vicingaceae bacterium]|jgi:YidC/Oxa1 family membrane protein insertase